MPNEIFVDISLGSLITSSNWTPSAGDISTIEAAINGTYSLPYSSYISGTARYAYGYGSPYQFPNDSFRFIWYCTAAGATSAVFDIDLCYSGAPYNADRYLRIEPNAGKYISTSDMPSITTYCSGTGISASISTTLRAIPDTACGTNPLSYQRLADFNLDLIFYE